MIILNTPSYDFDEEIDLINAFFNKGLDILYIDKPDKNYIQLIAYISGIDEIYHNRIIVCQHHDVAEDFILKGIHVSSNVRASLGEDLGIYLGNFVKQSYDISVCFDNLQEVKHHGQLPFSYVLIDLKGVQSHGVDLNEVKGNSFKYIAKGGISMIGIGLLQQMGFDGVYLSDEIWGSKKPLDMFNSFYTSFLRSFKSTDD